MMKIGDGVENGDGDDVGDGDGGINHPTFKSCCLS